MAEKLPKGWARVELGELVTISSGGTPNRATPAYWGSDVPWITAKDMKSFELNSSIEKLSRKGAEHATVVSANTVLILVRGMGLFKDVPVGIATREIAFNQDIKALQCDERPSPRYLAYALQSQRHRLMSRVDHAGHGTGRLQTALLETIPMIFPRDLQEQQLICNALDVASFDCTSLESVLDAHYRHYAASVEFLMRPVAKKRAHGWRRRLLGDVFTERDERGGDLPLLSIVGEGGVIPRDVLARRDTSAEDKSNYKVIRKGDIGYNTMRMWQGVCGLSSHDGVVSPAYTVVTPVNSEIIGEFVEHYFRHSKVIHSFWRYSQGMVDDTLTLKYPQFSEIRLPLPDLDLQRKIARTLSAQKRCIKVIEKLFKARMERKRGLMQQLLTGKKRLTSATPKRKGPRP
jgi:type I restriction enzyme S subunit